MIENKTVFVLGAGASRPYGYPSGIELRKEIYTHFYDKYEAYIKPYAKNMKHLESELDEAKEFTDKFHKSPIKSIDLFLALNREFQDIGKKAIALTILAAESVKKHEERMHEGDLDWYSNLFHKLTDDIVNKNDYIHFCENNVSFITFNYDRSLEYFLYKSLVHSFNKILPEKIKEQLIKLRIIHVFGQVAGLEWQDLPSKFKYAGDVKLIDIRELVKNIRIIYDEETTPKLKEAHELISKAEHIFFLGFGYAKENLKLLKIPEILYPLQNIYGTTCGFRPKETEYLKSIFSELDTRNVHIGNAHDDCLALLRDYL